MYNSANHSFTKQTTDIQSQQNEKAGTAVNPPPKPTRLTESERTRELERLSVLLEETDKDPALYDEYSKRFEALLNEADQIETEEMSQKRVFPAIPSHANMTSTSSTEKKIYAKQDALNQPIKPSGARERNPFPPVPDDIEDEITTLLLLLDTIEDSAELIRMQARLNALYSIQEKQATIPLTAVLPQFPGPSRLPSASPTPLYDLSTTEFQFYVNTLGEEYRQIIASSAKDPNSLKRLTAISMELEDLGFPTPEAPQRNLSPLHPNVSSMFRSICPPPMSSVGDTAWQVPSNTRGKPSLLTSSPIQMMLPELQVSESDKAQSKSAFEQNFVVCFKEEYAEVIDEINFFTEANKDLWEDDKGYQELITHFIEALNTAMQILSTLQKADTIELLARFDARVQFIIGHRLFVNPFDDITEQGIFEALDVLEKKLILLQPLQAILNHGLWEVDRLVNDDRFETAKRLFSIENRGKSLEHLQLIRDEATWHSLDGTVEQPPHVIPTQPITPSVSDVPAAFFYTPVIAAPLSQQPKKEDSLDSDLTPQ